jgi:hypothetical protein
MQNDEKKVEVKEVLLTEYNKNQFLQLHTQLNQINAELNRTTTIILEAQGIDYQDNDVKIAPDFSKLIVG